MRQTLTSVLSLPGALLLVLFSPVALLAQSNSNIAGLVRDATGAVLPGVTVEAASPALIEKVRSVVSDSAGQYKIVNLVPGVYTVTFTLPGFSTTRHEAVELTASFTATVNAEMRRRLERPARFEGRRLPDITPAELEQLRVERRTATAASSVAEDRPVDREAFWENLNAVNSRAWLMADPGDGKMPPMTAAAQQRIQARAAARRSRGRGPADSAADRSLYDRCISRGLPGSMMPAIYGSSYEVVQGPGFVAIVYEMVHETRVVPLDARPRVGGAIGATSAIRAAAGTAIRWSSRPPTSRTKSPTATPMAPRSDSWSGSRRCGTASSGR